MDIDSRAHEKKKNNGFATDWNVEWLEKQQITKNNFINRGYLRIGEKNY